MPSPIGHALAGAAVVLAADLVQRRPSPPRLVLTCAVLATLPDLDLVVTTYHRQATHSLTAVLLVLIIAAAVTGGVTRWRVAALCTAAYASHLFLDWMGTDHYPPGGIQLLWPWADRFFISGWNIFAQTERKNLFDAWTIAKNARAIEREIAILAPIAFGLWLIRVKTLPRFASELSGRNHPAQ